MVRYNKYIPILKGKAGEFTALNLLSQDLQQDIIPIIDIVPTPPNKTFDKHISDTVNYFKKYWQKDNLIYIDGYMIQDAGNILSGLHPMNFIFNELRKEKFNTVPVISNVTNLEYNAAIKNILEHDKKGICIRIFRKPVNNITDDIERLISFLEITPNQAELIIDLRSLEEFSVDELYNLTIAIIQAIPSLDSWRSFALAGTNFPIDLTKITADQVFPLQRKEWTLWKRLLGNNEIKREPSYSDYAISHPLLSKIKTKYPNPSASIRYTHEENFYIFRGRGTKEHGYEQFYDISLNLLNNANFYGRSHCSGDEFIYKCGMENDKKGRMLDWRRVGTEHHITVVVEQLRQFFRDFKQERTS